VVILSQAEISFINRNYCALKNRDSVDVILAFISMNFIGYQKQNPLPLPVHKILHRYYISYNNNNMLCNELYNSTRRPQSNFQMDCKELDNIINRYCVLNNVHMFIVLPVVVRR